MNESKRFTLLQLSIVILITLFSVGCFDHRRAVAFSTLVTDSGQFHQDAYGAAVAAKFPPGTPIEALAKYVHENHGDCQENQNQPGHLWCEIPLRGGICWVAELACIDIALDNGRIKHLDVTVGGLGC